MGGWKLLVRPWFADPSPGGCAGGWKVLGDAQVCREKSNQELSSYGQNPGFSSTSGWRQLDQILLTLWTAFL